MAEEMLEPSPILLCIDVCMDFAKSSAGDDLDVDSMGQLSDIILCKFPQVVQVWGGDGPNRLRIDTKIDDCMEHFMDILREFNTFVLVPLHIL
jgi:hypothetical protein